MVSRHNRSDIDDTDMEGFDFIHENLKSAYTETLLDQQRCVRGVTSCKLSIAGSGLESTLGNVALEMIPRYLSLANGSCSYVR